MLLAEFMNVQLIDVAIAPPVRSGHFDGVPEVADVGWFLETCLDYRGMPGRYVCCCSVWQTEPHGMRTQGSRPYSWPRPDSS